jgi:hypothetical protein
MSNKKTDASNRVRPAEKSIFFELTRPFYEPNNGATPWFTCIGLGSKPQLNLRYMIDTGTKNSWITSKFCETEACSTHRKFDPSQSSTYQKTGKPENIDFGAWGSMEVQPSKDVMHLPDLSAPLEIDFDLATKYSGDQFSELISDGGVAIPCHIPEGPNSTLLLNDLSQKGLIDAAVASFWYNPDTLKGEVQFGGLDKSRFKAHTLNKIPLMDFPEDLECWIVNLDEMNGLLTDGTEQNILSNVAFALDTGSSRFKGDPKFIAAAKTLITNNGELPEVIKSPQKVSDYPYPTLELVLNGRSYKIKPEHYFIKSSDTHCELAFADLADCENEFLVGTTFLQHVYSSFDFENRCIYIAEPILENH